MCSCNFSKFIVWLGMYSRPGGADKALPAHSNFRLSHTSHVVLLREALMKHPAHAASAGFMSVNNLFPTLQSSLQ